MKFKKLHHTSMALAAIVVLISLLTPAGFSYADPVELARATESMPMGKFLSFLEDKTGSRTIHEMIDTPSEVWSRSGSDTLSFGYTDSVYWMKGAFRNSSDKPVSRLIAIAYPVLDEITFYLVTKNNVVETVSMGDNYPFAHRAIPHRDFIFPLTLDAFDSTELYISIKTTSSMQIPATLLTKNRLIEKSQKQMICFGLYYGAMMVMVLYNLFVFISIREASYFYYVIYVISVAAFFAGINGISFQYLWPGNTWWNDQSLAVSIAALILFALLFIRMFLNIPGSNPRLDRAAGYTVGFCFALLAASFFLPYMTIIITLIFSVVFLSFAALITGIVRWIEGYSAARFYIVAWLSMLVGGAVLALNKLGVVPRNGFTENAAQIGSVLEVVLLSFALADRLNSEKKERFEAQKAALENERLARSAQASALKQEINAGIARAKALKNEQKAREAHEKALKIQRKANETLEHRVKLRTRELESANHRLRELSTTDALTGLKNRRYFNEIYYLEYIRAARELTPLAAIILDIDDFKTVNDTHGHLAGDECLKKVAETIRGQLQRENDFLARYGGEEFCILLPNTSAEGAVMVAETIRKSIESIRLEVNGQHIGITISAGVAVEIPMGKAHAEHLLSLADKALYQSKENEKNTVTLFTHSDMRSPDEPLN